MNISIINTYYRPVIAQFRDGVIIIIIIIIMWIRRSDFNDNIALLYSSSDHCIQPEDGLTRRGRNM